MIKQRVDILYISDKPVIERLHHAIWPIDSSLLTRLKFPQSSGRFNGSNFTCFVYT